MFENRTFSSSRLVRVNVDRGIVEFLLLKGKDGMVVVIVINNTISVFLLFSLFFLFFFSLD